MPRDEPVTLQKVIWAETLAKRKADLVRAKADQYIDIHDTEKAQQVLENLCDKHAQRKASSFLQKTASFFAGIKPFTSVIMALAGGPAVGRMVSTRPSELPRDFGQTKRMAPTDCGSFLDRV
jgi:hypothetical protein